MGRKLEWQLSPIIKHVCKTNWKVIQSRGLIQVQGFNMIKRCHDGKINLITRGSWIWHFVIVIFLNLSASTPSLLRDQPSSAPKSPANSSPKRLRRCTGYYSLFTVYLVPLSQENEFVKLLYASLLLPRRQRCRTFSVPLPGPLPLQLSKHAQNLQNLHL